uniref:Uncharacterized protein n=1 Tax=Glossina austeni TaxID=7395 RepID=A0A1A9VI62_GLOAU
MKYSNTMPVGFVALIDDITELFIDQKRESVKMLLNVNDVVKQNEVMVEVESSLMSMPIAYNCHAMSLITRDGQSIVLRKCSQIARTNMIVGSVYVSQPGHFVYSNVMEKYYILVISHDNDDHDANDL